MASIGIVEIGTIVSMCNDDDLVTESEKRVGEGPDVHFYAAKAGVEEVAYHGYAVPAVRLMLLPWFVHGSFIGSYRVGSILQN